MDDGIAQADTAFWQAAGGNEVCTCGADALAQVGLTDDEIADALDTLAKACGLGETVDAELEATLPPAATLEQLGSTMDSLADQCGALLEAARRRLMPSRHGISQPYAITSSLYLPLDTSLL